MGTSAPAGPTPFDAIGGRPRIERVVGRFYDLMESDPAYRELRALHAEDLAPMRASLAGFLTAWIGGPQDWFADHPGKCMMSMHRPVPINAQTADQWVRAMTAALFETGVEKGLADRMGSAFANMANQMARAG